MKVTFKNENAKGNIEEAGIRSLQSTKEDFEQFALDELKGEEDSGFYEYGLSFDAVEDEETGEIDYHRFQLSWGGPSEEIRFYPSGKIEYVFLDWFSGIGFDVTEEDWAQWVHDRMLCC